MNLLAQAQNLDPLPAGYWKLFCMSLLVLIGGVATVLWIISLVRQPEPTRLADAPPIEIRKAAKRYNHDATEARFAEIDRRLEAHDLELRAIQEDAISTDALSAFWWGWRASPGRWGPRCRRTGMSEN